MKTQVGIKLISTMKFRTILSCILVCLMGVAKTNAQDELKVSAYTFSIQPKVGMVASHTRAGVLIDNVYGDLKTTLMLFESANSRFLLVTSPLGIDGYLRKPIVDLVQEVLNLSTEAIVTSSSHSHTVPYLSLNIESPEKNTPQYLSWEVGKDFVKKMRQGIAQLENGLQTVTVEWGVAEENRISYNRRGVYPDGTTYFMREEDRQLVGEGYVGTIDPDASLVLFRSATSKKPVSAITRFAAHPVVAYNPEKQFSYGQFPQVASEMVSEFFDGIPVGFIQGTSGDINAKYMLTGTIEQAKEAGDLLGETFLIAAKNLRSSKRSGMEWSMKTAYVPYDELPSLGELEKSLAEIDDFVVRANAGDENTLRAVGMNFPRALTPPYRANLVLGVRNWYIWAIDQHRQNLLHTLPSRVPINVFTARFGDVGFVGLPYEVFVKTGLKIKREAHLPMVLAGGYTNGTQGYIPDASAADDREYMSGYFRYRQNIPPYKAPAGDSVAELAIRELNRFAK